MKRASGRGEKIYVRLRNLLGALHRILGTIRIPNLPSRVREVPDERTLRFYAGIGLLSPPARFDGRRALYTTRHLLELLAVKRLQARRLTIGEIRAQLADIPASRLAAVANVDSQLIRKALLDAARDPALNLWPRPGPGRVRSATEVPLARSSESSRRRSGVAAHKLADGVYLVIDPEHCGVSGSELRGRILAFAARELAGKGD